MALATGLRGTPFTDAPDASAYGSPETAELYWFAPAELVVSDVNESAYFDAIKRFIREEQRHARDLARFMIETGEHATRTQLDPRRIRGRNRPVCRM